MKDKATVAVSAQAYNVATDARESGARFHCPVLPKASGLAAGIDTWALALEAITSAGWVLHTWAILPDGSARPLFERVVDVSTITT